MRTPPSKTLERTAHSAGLRLFALLRLLRRYVIPSPLPKLQACSFGLMEAALVTGTFLAEYGSLGGNARSTVITGCTGLAILLMVASPFFLRSLRVIALLGWALGVGCFFRLGSIG